MRTLVTASVLTLSLVAAAANAQGVRTEKTLSLDLANQIAATAVATCATNGYAVSATVVDRAGTVRAVQRADNAGPHTLGASQQKAFTSAGVRTDRNSHLPAALRIRLSILKIFT